MPSDDITLSAMHAVEVTGLPQVGPALLRAVRSKIEQRMVWPRAVSLPLDAWLRPLDAPPPPADGESAATVDPAPPRAACGPFGSGLKLVRRGRG